MKKRLFLFLALIVAICALFAISASAKTVTTLDGDVVEVTIYDDFTMPTNLEYSLDDIVIFNDGFACPSVYIFKDSTEIKTSGTHKTNLKNALDFSFLEKHGKNYDIEDISELDLPQGLVTICHFVAYNLKTLRKITVPDSVTSFGDVGFQNATALEECVFEHNEDSGLTTLGGWMFYNCSSLKAVSLPDCITTFAGEGFHFGLCVNLTALYLPKKLQTITCSVTSRPSFEGCNKLYFVNKPFTTSDTAEAKPEVYYFPENLSTISNTCLFRGCHAMNSVMVFGANVTAIPNEFFLQNKTICTVVFLGNMTEVNANSWVSSRVGDKNIIFANPADESTDDLAYTSSEYIKSTLFCVSEADMTKHLESPKHSVISEATCYSNKSGIINCFCGREISRGEVAGTMLNTHDYVDDFDCTTANYCKNFGENKCNKLLVAEFDAHDEKHDVIFANGFTSAGVHNTYCSNATCKVLDEVENLSAMFVHEGYSYKSRTYGGIDTKFRINSDALKLYELYEGTLHFGIMIANANHFTNVDAFIKDGKLTSTNTKGENSGVIVEMTSREYDYFNCYIDGFKLDEPDHVALGLIIAGYVYGKDPTDITYIQKDYKTDDDQTTLEIPYVDTITKDKEVKIVNIVAVRDFEPIKETQQ